MSEKKTGFRVGDRVATYAVTRSIGFIEKIYNESALVKLIGNEYPTWFHPKQCRRLKKKNPEVPREIWVNINSNYCWAYREKKEADEFEETERVGKKAWRYVLGKQSK